MSPSFHRSMIYIITFIFIIMYSTTLYVNSIIIRVDQHFFAPFTLIDSNKRLVWKEPYCVQNITDHATVQQCVGACVLNKNCTTFNYHREKKICELLNKTKFDALGILQYQPGWFHYETDDDAQFVGPACNQLNPCNKYEVCEDTFTTTLYSCKCQDGFNGTECKNYNGPGSSQNNPPPACSLLMERYRNILNGEYWIQRNDGSVIKKNCTRHIRDGTKQQTSTTPSISTTTPSTVTSTATTNPIGSTLKYYENEASIVRGNLVTTIPRLSKYFTVSFEVYPTSFNQWKNVLHMTVGGDWKQYGDRIPCVFFRPDSKLHICSAINGNSKSCYDSMMEFPLNKWIKVKIQQISENASAMYKIYIDDNKVHEIVNTQPSNFDNVKVYVSNPWHPAQAGKIRKLMIITG